MKSLFLGAVLAFAVAACVDPATTAPPPSTPEPDSVTAPKTGEQGFTENENFFWYCAAAGPEQCILVSIRTNGALRECNNQCAAAGFSERCVLVSDFDSPCDAP